MKIKATHRLILKLSSIIELILLKERDQLVAITEVTKDMRDESLKNNNWYTFIPCEFAENVDEALFKWRQSK